MIGATGTRACDADHTASFKPVRTIPGDNAFTRTPYGAKSFAAHCVKLISPAFAAQHNY